MSDHDYVDKSAELFVKRFGLHFADPVYCGAAIEEMHQRLHEALKDAARWRKAYNEAKALASLSITSTESQDS